jgi:hypothetical protein
MSELEKYNLLMTVSLDYLIERYANAFVCDGFSSIGDYYEKQKQLIGKYYKQKATAKLKAKFDALVEGRYTVRDMEFANYIIQKTNQNIDIFKRLKDRVTIILEKKLISTEKEANDVSTVLDINKHTKLNLADERVLLNLLSKYFGNHFDEYKKSQANLKKVKLPPFDAQKLISPDGKKQLNIVRSNSTKCHIIMYVELTFKQATGTVYATSSLDNDLKAIWKDNQTIIITTKKGDTNVMSRYCTVQSFDEIVTIEYVTDSQ